MKEQEKIHFRWNYLGHSPKEQPKSWLSLSLALLSHPWHWRQCYWFNFLNDELKTVLLQNQTLMRIFFAGKRDWRIAGIPRIGWIGERPTLDHSGRFSVPGTRGPGVSSCQCGPCRGWPAAAQPWNVILTWALSHLNDLKLQLCHNPIVFKSKFQVTPPY